MNHSRNMLPILGVTWNQFATEQEAIAFAIWAEKETEHDQHPCDAYVSFDPDAPKGEQYEVKVRNW